MHFCRFYRGFVVVIWEETLNEESGLVCGVLCVIVLRREEGRPFRDNSLTCCSKGTTENLLVNKGVQEVEYWFTKAVHSGEKLCKWKMVGYSRSISLSKSPNKKRESLLRSIIICRAT